MLRAISNFYFVPLAAYVITDFSRIGFSGEKHTG